MFRKLQEKVAFLGTLNESKDTVQLESKDVFKTFEGTDSSNTLQYRHRRGLDKVDAASMVLLYTVFADSFDEADTFITKEFLQELKDKYLKCEPVTEECVVSFMKALSNELKINLVAVPLNGRDERAFKLTNDPLFANKYIYFDFGEIGAANIPPVDLVKMSTDYVLLIPEYSLPARRKSDETRRSSNSRNKTRRRSETSESERAAREEARREISERAASEEADREQARRDESEQARRDESEQARRDESEQARRDESEQARRDESEQARRDESEQARRDEQPRQSEPSEESTRSMSVAVSDSETRRPRSKTQRAVSDSEIQMYNEIIEGVTPNDDLSQYMTERFSDRVMLTPRQDALSSYSSKTAKQLYGEVKAINIFNKIVPAYLTKCTLTMKKSGLQVIHINSHMCQLITKLGFGTVDEKKLRLLRTYSTSVQLRTALQLRNLIAQIILKHKNPAEMEKDSMCSIDSEFIYKVLGEEQQTALLGVHHDRRDMITSFLTFRPSSLNEGERLEDEKLDSLWRNHQLAFIDVGCAPSTQNKNQLLLNRPGHYDLLMYYALLNIVAATQKRARKYAGICTTLNGDTPLEPLLNALGFQEVSFPRGKTFALYGPDEVFVELLDALDAKLNDFSSPYMTELCKGNVCK